MALNNSQYDSLMRVYQKRRLDNKHIQDRRIAEVYEAVPGLAACDREIGRVSCEQARKLLAGKRDAVSSLKEKLSELRKEKEELIRTNGFSPEYLEPVYTCGICRDTGYADGKKCNCLRQAEIALLYRQSNLEGILKTENFDMLSMDYYDKSLMIDSRSQYQYMEEKIAFCKNFARNYPKEGGNLLFTGPSGTGKSFLSGCIAGVVLSQMQAVLYLTSVDLFQMISDKRFDREDDSREEKYRGILDCDLLLIDDLGTELCNSFTNTELFYLINYRKQNGKGTVISTNMSMSELKEIYSERIVSRIFGDYTVIPLFGKDIRIQKKLSGNL